MIRVLVVDDEAVVTSLVRDALEEEGHNIETAPDGPVALELVRQKDFDLVISDIRMPGMDGIELISRIRDLQPGVSVIFMTGYADLNSAKNAIKHGAIDYIMKPFELSEIRQAVNKAINLRQDTTEATTDQQINQLSDLNEVLLSAGDQRSLIISSLKFALAHRRSSAGAALYWDSLQEQYQLMEIEQDKISETTLPAQPLQSVLTAFKPQEMEKTTLVATPEQHPVYAANPDPELERYLFPPWLSEETPMIVVPIYRGDSVNGFLMLQLDEDTVRIKEADIKVLTITTSQLAISLENLALLEDAQKAYARLREVQDEAIELERMATRGQISAEIGHELNNFVGVVAGNLSLIDVHVQKGEYDRLPKYLSAMTDTIAKIKTFTSNLMDLTPVSSVRETLYVDQVLREVVDFLRPQKRYADVTIRLENLPPEVAFEADSMQLQQLLYNLFNNAADATKGCPRREITAGLEVSPDRSTFQLKISDTGVGIEPELLEKAFREKFTTKESGHGFGLMVCNQIIERHDGCLHIDSTVNKGTTIAIDFPLASETTTERIPLEEVELV